MMWISIMKEDKAYYVDKEAQTRDRQEGSICVYDLRYHNAF